jgi:hypothetical protein
MVRGRQSKKTEEIMVKAPVLFYAIAAQGLSPLIPMLDIRNVW